MSAKKDLETRQRQGTRSGTHYHVVMSGQQFLVVRHAHAWRPPTDVIEVEDRLIVNVEIAGMRDSQFTVAIDSQKLTVSGSRASVERQGSAYHQLEVRFGEFFTEVALPWPVDEDAISARYDDGFLRIDLPRAKAQTVRVIAVDKQEEPPS